MAEGQITLRLGDERIQRIEAEAARRGWSRTRLTQWIVDRQLAEAAGAPMHVEPDPRVLRWGQWLAALDPAIRCKVREIGESLSLLYNLRRDPDGRIRLDGEDGVVENRWTPARRRG